MHSYTHISIAGRSKHGGELPASYRSEAVPAPDWWVGDDVSAQGRTTCQGEDRLGGSGGSHSEATWGAPSAVREARDRLMATRNPPARWVDGAPARWWACCDVKPASPGTGHIHSARCRIILNHGQLPVAFALCRCMLHLPS